MQVNSNQNNLQALEKALGKVKQGQICIASGWIKSGMLRQVLAGADKAIRSGKVQLRLIIRAGEPIDLKITDWGVFNYLQSLLQEAQAHNGFVEYRYSAKHHAKMYIADTSTALVGSYNLTGGGFGTDDRPGSNPETGIITEDPQEIQDIQARFNEIWEDSEQVHPNLAGFVANAASNREFFLFATRPLASGTFLQYELDAELDGKKGIVLCKVEESLRYHEEYPQMEAGQIPDPELFQTLGTKNQGINAIQGIALSGTKATDQLHVVRVKGLNTIEEQNGNLVFGPVNLPPRVSAQCRLADPSLLVQFFNPAEGSYACLEENPDVEVSFNESEILSKHMAVLGSTGSGKSYFVKQFLKKSLAQDLKSKNLRLVIIDTHGEYDQSLSDMQGLTPIEILDDPALAETATASYAGNVDDVKELIGTPSKEEKTGTRKTFFQTKPWKYPAGFSKPNLS
jgi:hypothetical protein